MKVIWGINDGYCVPGRRWELEVDDNELKKYKTDEDKEQYLYDCIQQMFNDCVSWEIIEEIM